MCARACIRVWVCSGVSTFKDSVFARTHVVKIVGAIIVTEVPLGQGIRRGEGSACIHEQVNPLEMSTDPANALG